MRPASMADSAAPFSGQSGPRWIFDAEPRPSGTAELLGVDRSYVAKIERGHSSPLVDLMLHALVDLGGTVKVEFDERTDG